MSGFTLKAGNLNYYKRRRTGYAHGCRQAEGQSPVRVRKSFGG
jgi:hypothetical protein